MLWLLRSLVCFFLAGVLLIGPVAATEPQTRYAPWIAHYESLTPAEQVRTLEALLFDRSARALRQGTSPNELQTQQARHRRILDRARAGREFTSEGLERLLSEIDQQEKQAIEKLGRDFEFSTAQTYHAERALFEKHMRAWKTMRGRWQADGEPFDWQPKIIAWLERALNRQQQKQFEVARASQPLPPPVQPQPQTVPMPEQPTLVEQVAKKPTFVPRVEPDPPAPISQSTAPQLPVQPSTVQQPPVPKPPVVTNVPKTAPARRASTTQPTFDTQELTARISGYNIELATFIASMHHETEWTAKELVYAMDSLTDLAQSRADLELYWRLLPSERQVHMPKAEQLEGAIALLAAKTAQRRRILEQSPQGDRQAEAELRRLDAVSERLAKLATRRY